MLQQLLPSVVLKSHISFSRAKDFSSLSKPFFWITYDGKTMRQANEAGKKRSEKIHSSFTSTEKKKKKKTFLEMEPNECLSQLILDLTN